MSNAPVCVAGVVLAAGAGTRFGTPKALVESADGTSWLTNAVRSLLGGGCSPVIVVLGAAADEAEALLRRSFSDTESVRVVLADDWQSGMAASLRSALAAASAVAPEADAVAIVTVDVPSLGSAEVRRLIAPEPDAVGRHTLRQASFSGRPGHPVVIGRAHWQALDESATGDIGARPYLVQHGARLVDCSDLGNGTDVDSRNDPAG
ncbi:molybdenum cofactor cytidylyltransferase [Agreia bicolorata]|uniref:Molybdenum cofactor cytidylyltransferase n=1 Tax=Agreia bicolorata TaxID=110935 RepID=A0A1T4YG47_9MICO|nr:NTP transferase domain-containing protein [Agreia bicolorata]SKB00759.1 molybdenum cofactor cytidylyltransferase [Agreia bicolorata]